VTKLLQCGGHISFNWCVNAIEFGSANTPRPNTISDVRDLKKVKHRHNKIYETRAEVFLAAIKALGGEGGGGILLGDNTGGRADMLQPNRLRCSCIWIPNEFRCLLI
jgi:hypothetical protein